MADRPAPTDEETKAALHGEDALFFRHILLEFVNQGAAICQLTLQQAKAQVEQPEPAAGPAIDDTIRLCRVTRSVRQTMMYARKLTAPAPKADDSAGRRVAARKQIIRQVEDSIHRDAAAGEAESLHGELLERMEAPEFDDEIEDRPVADIVADIRADLGIGGPGSQERRKRRTPADIAVLCGGGALG